MSVYSDVMALRRGLWALLALTLAALASLGACLALHSSPSGRDGSSPTTVDGEPSLSLLGQLPLGGFNGDVWGHRGFAYVGTWGSEEAPGRAGPGTACPSTGVKIIDVRDPTSPRQVATAAGRPGTTAEDLMVRTLSTPAYQGDLLAVGIQRCVPFGQGVEGGVDLWDVTDPARPQHLAFFSVGEARYGQGVHELYLFQREGRAYVLLADPLAERDTQEAGLAGRGLDFKLVEVTDPRRPVLLSQWGANSAPGIPFRDGGSDSRPTRVSLLHSVWADPSGRRAFLSYWDSGLIVLDISDPASPRYLGRFEYGPQAEGNTHSAVPMPGREVVVLTDEDLRPSGPPGVEDGWGYVRILDVSDPASPSQVATFATDDARSQRQDGIFSVHNPFFLGSILFLSWYSDGLVVLDLSQPGRPRQVASFVPPAHPDPYGVHLPGRSFPFVWGVWAGEGLVLLSDVNFGLYVLEYRG